MCNTLPETYHRAQNIVTLMCQSLSAQFEAVHFASPAGSGAPATRAPSALFPLQVALVIPE